MNGKTAFARIEKAGAGLLPVVLISGLATLATILVVELAASIPKYSSAITSKIIDAGSLLGKSVGFGDRYEAIPPDSDYFKVMESARQEVEVAFPSPSYTYVGAFQLSDFPNSGFYAYLDAFRHSVIEVINFKSTGSQQQGSQLVCFSSITTDGELIMTCNTQIPSFKTPWIKKEVVAIEGPLSEIAQKLSGIHQERVASLNLRKVEPEEVLKFSQEQTARTAIWLIEQAPLPASVVTDYMNESGTIENKEIAALLLMGFCNEASKFYDRVAIEAHQHQMNLEGKAPVPTEELFALHAMTNELHLCELFPRSISNESTLRRLKSDWVHRTALAGKADMKQIENLFIEFTKDDPLVQVGAIEKPFRAKIFQRTGKLNEKDSLP